MEEAETEHVLTLLRLILGESAGPPGSLPRAPDGHTIPADAWFPRQRVMVSLRAEEEPDVERARRDHMADAYDVQYVVVSPLMLARDAAGDAALDPDADGRMLRDLLGVEGDIPPHSPFEHATDTVHHTYVWWDADGPPAIDEWGDWDEEDWDDEDELLDLAGRDREPEPETPEDAAGPHALPLDHPEVRYGWRGRAIGLALLGGAALARRAFGPQGAPKGLSAGSLEVLAALTLGLDDDPSDTGLDPARIAVAVARRPAHVRSALTDLEDRGLVEQTNHEYDPPAWRATAAGRDTILDWLARVAALVGTWPPAPPPDVES